MGLYENVKSACKEKNVSVNALEDQLKFARGSIYKWNQNIPSVEKVKAVADALDKPIEYFLQ